MTISQTCVTRNLIVIVFIMGNKIVQCIELKRPHILTILMVFFLLPVFYITERDQNMKAISYMTYSHSH